MRTISAGFTTPEERLAPVPFYYNQAPPIYRWNQWRGVNKWDTFQRWFYTCFCGRTMESIWETECGTQDEADIKNQGDYSDPLNWSLPVFTHPAVGAEYLGEPHAYANYFELDENVRPANPKTGLAHDTLHTADDIYIASRHAYPRCTFRIAMKLPSAAEIIAMHAAHAATMDTYMGVGFEVNSQGSHLIFALELVEDVTLFYRLRCYAPGQTKRVWDVNIPVTINNPGAWVWYEFEYDPPVIRFTQPTAGQTYYWGTANAAITELSVPTIQAQPLVQPMIFNESNAYTGDHLSWYVGQWAIWPTTNSGNVYSVNTRTNPSSACAPQTAIFDTGSRPYVHINLKSGCGCAYYIYHTEDGASQAASNQEVRTWRRIDNADWTGVTDTPYGEAGIGLFNAARFLCVVQAGCNACNVQEIVFTANSGGST